MAIARRLLADPSLVMAAALGTAIGALWLVHLGIGWIAFGAVIPIAIIRYMLDARWWEIGWLLLLNGVVPAIGLLLGVSPQGQPDAEWIPTDTVTLAPTEMAMSAAIMLIVLGVAALGASALGEYRRRRHIDRLEAHRRSRP